VTFGFEDRITCRDPGSIAASPLNWGGPPEASREGGLSASGDHRKGDSPPLGGMTDAGPGFSLRPTPPPMRILVLTNLYPPHYLGGYELRCRDITEALAARGHQVRVLTSNHRVPGAAGEPERSYKVDRSLRPHGFFGTPWLGIRELQGLERFNNRELLAAIGLFQPDLVHVWNLGGLSKSLALTLQGLNIPTVYDVSDHWIARSLAADVWLDWWNRPHPSLRTRLLRGLWQLEGRRHRWQGEAPTNPIRHLNFQRIYFCSQRLRQITCAAGYPVQQGGVIHCPVDTRHFLGEPKPASEPLKRLLYVGRLAKDKGILTALHAMRSLGDRFQGTLSIYGSGDPAYETMLKGYAKAHRMPVSFHEATPDQMPEVYRSHDALLFTSEWEEPFALTPLEAMACGLPVIGTTTGGSENALTYPAGDSLALAERILELAADPVRRAAMAAAGHAEVRHRFPLHAIVDQVEQYLGETLSEWQRDELPSYRAA
jgi:glycogen synthase